MRAAGVMLIVFAMRPVAVAAQEPPPPPPASAAIAAAYALVAPDLGELPVRTDISFNGDSLLLRVRPVNVEGERQPRGRRPVSDVALDVHIIKDAAGDIARLTVTGALTPRQRVVVAETTTEAGRTNALRAARFGPGRAADVKTMARKRAAIDAPVPDASLVWRRVGAQQEAVWEVRMPLSTSRGSAAYIARFSAGDGALVGLERVTEQSREVVR